MARKNIFQLIEENYDIQSEICKINNLFLNENYFKVGYNDFTFKKIIVGFLFNDWKYRGTCITLDECFERAYADIDDRIVNDEDTIINNLELMENFIKLFSDNCIELFQQHKLRCYETFDTVFCHLIDTLEKKMGLSKREYKDRIILYPKNASLEKVIDLCEDEDVQWELIRYVREDLSLNEKRKSLAYLATNLNIEDDKEETNEHINAIMESTRNVLNNLHIRHNNKTGKWENKALQDLDEADAITLCDMVYNEMLTITLLRDHKTYETTYIEFNKKQKAAKAKKKAGGTENG